LIVKQIMLLAAAAVAVSGIATSQPANAAGCLRGAAVGGVAGHFMGHHGLVGAGVGCLWGRHEANKREREEMRYRAYDRY
jgi:hypothetical protein